MKNTGIIRRIDELGRIVIPKEIRDVLKINNGDELEIFTEKDCILLHKYSQIRTQKDKSDQLISTLSPLVDGLILLGDKDKIISRGPYENQNLSEKIKGILLERKPYLSNKLEEYTIGQNTIKGYFYFYPILHNSIIKGVIILIKTSIINKEDEIFINVLKNIIDNF